MQRDLRMNNSMISKSTEPESDTNETLELNEHKRHVLQCLRRLQLYLQKDRQWVFLLMLNHIEFQHKLNMYNSLVKQQKLENDEMNEKSIWIHQELNNGLTDQESFLTQKMVKMKFAYKVFHAFEVQDTDALTRFQNQQ